MLEAIDKYLLQYMRSTGMEIFETLPIEANLEFTLNIFSPPIECKVNLIFAKYLLNC